MTELEKENYATNLEFFEKLVATFPEIEQRGATMPFTSHNGHMFSLFAKRANLACGPPKR